MAQNFQTSFIPTGNQSSIPSSMIPGGPSGSKKDILGTIVFLITLVIFIATALYTGYSIWYEKNLTSQIESLKQELTLIREEILDGEISGIEKMNNRLNQSNNLLRNHLAPILLFTILEETTLPTLTFSNFVFEAKEQNYQITASGQAANFESIVYQSDVYGDTPAFKDVLFSNLQRTTEGNVTFSFSTFVTPESVQYLSRDFSILDGNNPVAEPVESPIQAGNTTTPGAPNSDQAEIQDSEGDPATEPAVIRLTPDSANSNEI